VLASDIVAPVVLEYETPLALWLAQDSYNGAGLLPLEYAVEQQAKPLLDLYFGPLVALRRDWLAVEFTGNRRISQTAFPTDESADLPPVFSTLVKALELHFPDHFAARRALVLCHYIDNSANAAARRWALKLGVEYFANEQNFMNRLSQLSDPSPGQIC
jgi:hypothetical protein